MSGVKMKHALAAAVTGFSLLGAGCVEKNIEPAYIPKVSSTQNNEGVVSISWPSRKGYNYRLSAQDETGKLIVDKKVYKGTGDIIDVEFKRDPQKPLPDYRVIPEKLTDH